MNYKITEFDLIYLSFDEPTAEELYAELLNQAPWAKRVHGVKGFDSAHRACADISDTDFFVTIDGDNKVYPSFYTLEVEIKDHENNHAWTWASRNNINGLVYGNGGIKLWSKNFVYSMNTHENADNSASAVDFCWHSNYSELEGCYSTSIINSSAYQAWRSGFREGVKMSLDRGQKVKHSDFLQQIWFGNITRLLIWQSIGADVENGIWAMLGARMGCYYVVLTDNDHTIISDYNLITELWNNTSTLDPFEESLRIGDILYNKIGLNSSMLSADNSRFFKTVYMNIPRPFLSWDRIKHFMATNYN